MTAYTQERDAMISMVGRQVWPQILAVARCRPRRLYLVHTGDVSESLRPARRLRAFFSRTKMLPAGRIRLVKTSHDTFDSVRDVLDGLKVDRRACILNFTGGNKIMAAGALQWARSRMIPALYIERNYTLTWFRFDDPDAVRTTQERLPVDMLDPIDPADLIRCHMDTSEIEEVGELIKLRSGIRESVASGDVPAVSGNPDKLLHVTHKLVRRERKGDTLERMVSFTLLTLGVPMVRRGVRLKPRGEHGRSFNQPHGEIDILINFRGRIWVVDCKDRADWQWIPEMIEERLFTTDLDSKDNLISRVRAALFESEFKHLKQDVYAARELGGLNAGIICVRKAEPSEDELQYAHLTGVHMVLKRKLTSGIRAVLFPGAQGVEAVRKGAVM